MIADTPEPPYYAVIFTNQLRADNPDYHAMAAKMLTLAEQQPGFLGFESARSELGISVSYWESPEAIKAWREHSEHQIARKFGREDWYASYCVRVARVEREYAS